MTDHSALAAEVEAFSGVRVLCVGDVMLDRFAYGEVERISPEAPIPVFRHQHEATMAGGAGNVLRNLSAIGVAARIVAVIGDDAAGAELRALIEAEPGAQAELFAAKGRETTIKTRYIAGSQQLLRADRETTTDIEPGMAERIVATVAAAVAETDAIVLSDYGKGVLTPEVTARIIEAARQAGKPVVVDPKGPDMSHYRGASVVTPNRRELAEASGLAVSDDAEIIIAAEKLIAGCGFEAVLVTRAKDGMTLVTAAGAEHLEAMKREVFDVSGAGDTVVATLAAAIGAGVALVDAAAIANAAAGVVVGKVGTAAVEKSELIDALHGRDRSSAGSKLASFEAALERIARWRRKGLRIGFTNGCFDILHPGHVSLFDQARGACDRLVVGLNSDASVARLKGAGRPLQAEAARAAVLGSVASIDLVVVFADDTPMKLIEAIRPDVLVKGGDYTIEEVVGAEFVQSYGAKVLLAEIAPGHGTTQTIARMVK
ncbi:MAG: D-glycero-beta-D-manno-heptose-7-phosphate kinase [Alphaproteobacteria bacterium]|jgi:D-beta-D-heptose 7-phosphate kinase/D-beta-D-heptose 1-phosphate adenosyltransferase